MNSTVSLIIRSSSAVKTLVVEPYAGRYDLDGRDTEVRVSGDLATPLVLEIVGTELVLSIFDSVGAEADVLRDGQPVPAK